MAKRKKRVDDYNGDGWLATYADTITLILTFFVLLYSMSTIDNAKLKKLSQAFKLELLSSSGDKIIELNNGENPIIDGNGTTNNVENSEVNESEYSDEYLKALEVLYNKVSDFAKENNLTSEVQVIKTEKGVVLQLNDTVLFETASAELNANSHYILGEIYKLIYTIPNEILVEGHTDNRPINTDKYPSNWELSTARAVNVVKFFIETKNLSPERFSAAGYGEYKPVSENNTEENMAQNRRVSILILNSGR